MERKMCKENGSSVRAQGGGPSDAPAPHPLTESAFFRFSFLFVCLFDPFAEKHKEEEHDEKREGTT